MNGLLDIVGLGPGPSGWQTADCMAVLAAAEDLVGYRPYVDRVPTRWGLVRHASDNRVELDRARQALTLAASGRRVALVSGGDAGVFGMAAAVFEAIERDTPRWDAVPIRVHPGVTAALAAAARLGAPLGHDFCIVSLSDNLKPWAAIERRLRAAAGGDFVLALYNAASKARPQAIFDAFALLRELLPPTTVVVFARAVGRPEETVQITDLARAEPGLVDMSTLVLIGAQATRVVRRPDGGNWVYTPRSLPERA